MKKFPHFSGLLASKEKRNDKECAFEIANQKLWVILLKATFLFFI